MSDSKSETSTAGNGFVSDETRITLGLLNAIHDNSAVTQRSVAKELGIALGLANSYLRRCMKKGLVKVQQAPANRYVYYLTPHGFAEKSRLTARYLSMSFDFFRHARTQCSEVFGQCRDRGWRRVVLAGTGDLGEIATLCARETDVELVSFWDPAFDQPVFAGLPVIADIGEAGNVDAVVITDLKEPQAIFGDLCRRMPHERILAPRLLRVSRGPAD